MLIGIGTIGGIFKPQIGHPRFHLRSHNFFKQFAGANSLVEGNLLSQTTLDFLVEFLELFPPEF